MTSDFQEGVWGGRGRHGEESCSQVQDYGHGLETAALRGGEGCVGEDLRGGFDAAAQVEEGAGAGARGEDGEVCCEGLGGGEEDASDFVGLGGCA